MADFTLYKGADRAIEFTWRNPDNTPKNITGGTVVFRAAKKPGETPILTKTSADTGITLTNAAVGEGKVNIDEADFASVGRTTEYQCSLVLTLAGRTHPQVFSISVVPIP